MATALYRRYRPETFAQLIGQQQVTEPLATALRTDRVNHAYLFSGPRGCGKTTSARILARCLNCAEGPTPEPCGVCPSCVDLSRDGAGSLDVVEIDAASHNGVDDARDLRERAFFAPARDRYKIFILDEAHMVTPQGFNALLKIVEEPPEHVKFIFATTEPDKVIGTIRSRTHHYPFRLVPPATMLPYLEQLLGEEGVAAAAGVLPLVVRAGGGSVRDTLSVLDQLIAGSDGSEISYERAVGLLGYTHGSLLDEVVDALADRDPAAAYAAIDRMVQTGQDPRRFVEDLLERLRDLIVVAAAGAQASAVLRGVTAEEIEHMGVQARRFGAAALSRAADLVNDAFSEMSGATAPRLQLELMIARILVDTPAPSAGFAQAAPATVGGAGGSATQGSAVSAGPAPGSFAAAAAAAAAASRQAAAASPAASSPSSPTSAVTPPSPSSAASAPSVVSPPSASSAASAPSTPPAAKAEAPVATPAASKEPLTLARVRDAWPQVLAVLEQRRRSAWLVVANADVRGFDQGGVLTLAFPSEGELARFKQNPSSPESASEQLRAAIQEVLGVRVKYLARVAAAPASGEPEGDARSGGARSFQAAATTVTPPTRSAAPSAPAAAPASPAAPAAATAIAWPEVAVPGGSSTPEAEDAAPVEPVSAAAPATPASAAAPTPVAEPDPSAAVADSELATAEPATAAETEEDEAELPLPGLPPRGPQYGEAVLREVLQASLLAEEPAPEPDEDVLDGGGYPNETSDGVPLPPEPTDERDR